MDKIVPKTRQVTNWRGEWRRTWCGPYVVAVVCGIEYEPAYQILKNLLKKRHAKGVTNSDINAACRYFGVKVKWTKMAKRTQLRKFLPTLEIGKVYIVQITKHVLVVDTRDMTTIDNQSIKWIAAETTPHKAKLVHAFFEVSNPKFQPKQDDSWLIEPLAASTGG